MIAPEVGRAGNGESGRRNLLRLTLAASALIFMALQFWRPCFFLTDDNLDGGLPFFSEVGRHLLAGRSPFFSDYLFGGHYNLLRDPIFFAWHPLYLLTSLLVATPLRLCILDVDAFALLMLATAGFVNLAWYLRRELGLTVTNGWIVFYTLSFVYSMIALTTGASWMTFLGNLSALPWLTLGLLASEAWWGTALIALFAVHQILGGHLAPTISSTLLLSVFAVALGIARRSWRPLLAWAAGNFVAGIIVLPLLWPALNGFLDSSRGAHGTSLVDMQNNNISLEGFPTAIFLGMALWLIHPAVGNSGATYVMALGASTAAWCLVPALLGRNWRRLDLVLAGLLVLTATLIIRPIWISTIMLHIPLLKSMRWPFRELLQFEFFLHLFFVVRPPGLHRRLRVGCAWLGAILFIPPLLLHQPPTFAAMSRDRTLMFSGAFDSYWAKVRSLLHPDERVAVIIPPRFYLDEAHDMPFSLLGTYNYAELGRFRNVWGWSQTPPQHQYDVRTVPQYVFGAYTPSQRAALQAEDPAIRFITLEKLQPLRITLSLGAGPPIDLTPVGGG